MNKEDLYDVLNDCRVIKSPEEIQLLDDITKISSEAMKSSIFFQLLFFFLKFIENSFEIRETWIKRVSTLRLV